MFACGLRHSLAADELRWHRGSGTVGGLMRLMPTSKCYQISDPASSHLLNAEGSCITTSSASICIFWIDPYTPQKATK